MTKTLISVGQINNILTNRFLIVSIFFTFHLRLVAGWIVPLHFYSATSKSFKKNRITKTRMFIAQSLPTFCMYKHYDCRWSIKIIKRQRISSNISNRSNPCFTKENFSHFLLTHFCNDHIFIEEKKCLVMVVFYFYLKAMR